MALPTNVAHLLETADGPINGGQFSAQSSLVNAAAQFVPQGAALTALAGTAGAGNGITVMAVNRIISRMRAQFIGNAANVAGQTVTIILLLDGVAIAGATSGALATTAGLKTSGVVEFTAPITLTDGQRLTCTLTPSAGLTAAVTDVDVAVG